jgi:4-amino-4-deoxychorismate lyase
LLFGPRNEIVYAKELAADEPSSRSGKTLRLLKLPRSTPESDLRLKSFHYMNNIVAKRELNRSNAKPGTEGLFLDGNGYIVEGMVSNVFWLSGGALYTPSAATGLLEGITREYVLELAARLGIPTHEGQYRWEELLSADEAFVTNSIQEVVPVTTLENFDGQATYPGNRNTTAIITTTTAGPLTQRLMREYRLAAEGGNE